MPHASATARTNQMRALMGGAFLPSFLGLAATRVWLQVNLFASYTQSDDGLFTVVNNLAYGLVMVIGAAIALRKPFSKGNRTAVAWLGFAVMTFSTVLILAGKETGAVDILAVASVCAGIGGALGGGMWTAAYVRLGLRQSVLYGFLSLALGSLGGLALSFLPEALSYTVSMFMPTIALLCYQRAMKTDVGPQPAPEPIYDKEPRSTMLFIFGGLAVFGLALGISRGFPAGEPVPMDALQRVVHQMGVVVISLFIIWWFIVKRKRLSFSFLWRIEIMLVAAGMLILSVFPGHFTGLAIATVNIADTLMLGVLWIKALLPKMLDVVNLIPWKLRYTVTAIATALMLVNAIMTLQSLDCWYGRLSGHVPETPIEQFYATYFDNDFMANRFESMTINPDSATRGSGAPSDGALG